MCQCVYGVCLNDTLELKCLKNGVKDVPLFAMLIFVQSKIVWKLSMEWSTEVEMIKTKGMHPVKVGNMFIL